MYYSKISSRVRVFVNAELVLSTKATESQYYKFKIRYRPLYIIKIGEIFDLRYGSVSSQAVLNNKNLNGTANNQEKQEKIPEKEQKTQLRRSLPTSLPSNIPKISFKREVKEVDLLDLNEPSNNPFDFCEEEKPQHFKTASLLTTNNSVPWPSSNLLSLRKNN